MPSTFEVRNKGLLNLLEELKIRSRMATYDAAMWLEFEDLLKSECREFARMKKKLEQMLREEGLREQEMNSNDAS